MLNINSCAIHVERSITHIQLDVKRHLTNHLRLSWYPPTPFLQASLHSHFCRYKTHDPTSSPLAGQLGNMFERLVCFRSAGASFMSLINSKINTSVTCHNHINTRKIAARNVPQPETATVCVAVTAHCCGCVLCATGLAAEWQSVIASGLIRHRTFDTTPNFYPPIQIVKDFSVSYTTVTLCNFVFFRDWLPRLMVIWK